MKTVKRYSLSNESDENQNILLLRDNQRVGASIEGAVLEAQFELDDGNALIWLTDDSPYDEGLHIYLLGQDCVTLDSLEAGVQFNPGILKIKDIGENWVDFEFFTNGVIYRLEVVSKPALRLKLPAGWKYKRLLSKHRLLLKEIKEEIE